VRLATAAAPLVQGDSRLRLAQVETRSRLARVKAHLAAFPT
jgi:hypothetical protein